MEDTDKNQNSYQIGSKIIRDYVVGLPDKPGVYRMIGVDNKVLYVGKAKNLKNRVSSYTRITGLSTRIMRMVSLTQNMEFSITKTEAEAFLLEADLIKNLKPYFNILLRDDKSYPYIMFTKSNNYPQILKYRGKKDNNLGEYFGPFASNQATEQTIEILQKVFLLRNCTDYNFANRSRPCLLYQIKRCSAPCTNYISASDYMDSVKNAQKFLTKGSKPLIKELSDKMYELSDAMDFEGAALYRDRLKAVMQISGTQNIYSDDLVNVDFIAVSGKNGRFCVQVMFIRAGQNWGSNSYFPNASDDNQMSDILDSFIGQFYQNNLPADKIILSHKISHDDIISQALSEKYDKMVTISHGISDDEVKILSQMFENADLALAQKNSDMQKIDEALSNIADLFKLPQIPKRIEIYDNAHISGTNAVGAMVVMTASGFDKKQYRTWNMKFADTKTDDDYSMMREVFTRRFERIKIDILENIDLIPDLILIDGGQGQLSVVQKIADQMDIDIPIIAVAKGADRNAGRERFFRKSIASFILPPNDSNLFFIQKMRDEAHRFANGTHAKKRKKSMEYQAIDDISGIGGARKKALIAKFGSNKAIADASIEEIAQTPNISQALAEKIYNFFHDDS